MWQGARGSAQRTKGSWSTSVRFRTASPNQSSLEVPSRARVRLPRGRKTVTATTHLPQATASAHPHLLLLLLHHPRPPPTISAASMSRRRGWPSALLRRRRTLSGGPGSLPSSACGTLGGGDDDVDDHGYYVTLRASVPLRAAPAPGASLWAADYHHHPRRLTMKLILSSKEVAYPDDVTVTVKGREVSVKGPRGELSNNFNHVDVAISHDAAAVSCCQHTLAANQETLNKHTRRCGPPAGGPGAHRAHAPPDLVRSNSTRVSLHSPLPPLPTLPPLPPFPLTHPPIVPPSAK